MDIYQRSNSVSFTVTAPVVPTATVFPSSVILGPKGAQQFTASINGSGSVIWSIQEGASGGSISSAGFYTPNHLGTFHVVATSTTNSDTASATVCVVAAGFSAAGSMHVARSGHTATLLKDGRVLIVGGGNDSAELFDPATGTFSSAGTLNASRLGFFTATLLTDGRVLIAGGLGPGTTRLPTLDTADLFDPLTGGFTATGKMVQARVKHTATLLNDGQVLLAGGSSDGGFTSSASAEVYDPVARSFRTTAFLISERVGHTATLLPNGEVLVTGGWNGHAPDAPDDPPWDPLFSELYDPSSGGFQASANMSTTRIGHTATALASGKVLIMGGIPSAQNLHFTVFPSYAELYGAVTHTFSPLANVLLSQTGYTSTLLDSGMVLIVGGELNGAVTTTESLDPDSGTLTPTGGLLTARKGHTATRLLDGRVLVVGGTDTNGNPLASAEIYQ
jgi:hypothetical protein